MSDSLWPHELQISPELSLGGLMLKLKLQYFGPLMRRTDSFEKTLILGKTEGGEGDDRGWDGWMALLTQWTWVWVISGSWWGPGVLQSMGSQRVGHNWVTELNWISNNLVLPLPPGKVLGLDVGSFIVLIARYPESSVGSDVLWDTTSLLTFGHCCFT